MPYEEDEVTRLIIDGHDADAFAPVASLTVGEFRDWLLGDAATAEHLAALAPGLTPEMAAAVVEAHAQPGPHRRSPRKCRVVTRFRNTLGLPGRLSTRLQPNHPTDDPRGIAASILDGLLLRQRRRRHRHQPGDRQPAARRRAAAPARRPALPLDIPTQSCVLTHVTTTMEADRRARRSIWSSSRSPAPRRPTAASASTSRCSARRARRRWRCSAAPSATT